MFMREVDEAVRQDDVASFASRYGWRIGGGVAVALAAFAGYLWWDNLRETAQEQRSEQLISALDQLERGDPAVADQALARLAGDEGAGAGAIAVLLRAGLALQQGRGEEAGELYAQVAGNADLPRELRDLATVREVAARFDSLDPQVVIDRLGPLATPQSAWFGSAGEMLAFAYLAQGKEDQAGPLLVEIARAEDVPETLRSRARQLAGVLGHDPVDDVDALLDQQRVGGGPAAQGPTP